MKKALPVIIFGSAGASTDIYYWIKAINCSTAMTGEKFNVLGFIDNEKEVGTLVHDNLQIIGKDDDVSNLIRDYCEVGLVVPFGEPKLRKKIVDRFKKSGNVSFPNIIHPTVIYEKDAGTMGIGNHVGPGVIIASVYDIGDFNYISAGSLLGHDIVIGNFNSINPLAAVAGDVNITEFCTVGINSTVRQGITLRPGTTLGAGAVLVKDTEGDEVLVGIPANKLKKK